MPIYSYKCLKTGEEFDKLMPLSAWNQTTIYCAIHGPSCFPHCAEKIPSLPAKMELGKPTVVFVNPSTGEAQVAAGTHDSPPPGFVKQELKSSIERSRFEQVQNKINSEKDMIYNESNRLQTEEARKALHDDINANLNAKQTDYDEHGNKVEFFYDEPTKKLMKEAMHRKRKPLKKRKTQFAFDVNHKDKSNLK